MVKSKTKISKQINRKQNPELVQTLVEAKKNENWLEIARILSGPRRKRINLNLEEIEKNSKEGDAIVIPGKVLSLGEINKKLKIVALDFSEKAKEKILNSKGQTLSICEEIKANPKAKGVKILK